ncbi:MAG: MBOAT family protein, partial [Bacteroidota bacterium]
MTFNSLQFLFFLPLALVAYYLFPPRRRWIILLLLSYVFYAGWKVEYLVLIVYSTLVDYVASIMIHGIEVKWKRKLWLGLSLISNFGLLILFKYFHFLIGGSA